MNSAAHVAVVDTIVEREHLQARLEQALAPSTPVARHVVGRGDRLLDLRLLLRLKDRAVRARNRDRVLRQNCGCRSEDKRQRIPETGLVSEANHAVSLVPTIFAPFPSVKQHCSSACAKAVMPVAI